MQGRRGFTIIELLTVTIIIGLLASIALPKLASTRERAQVAAMVSDLRNLMLLQEAFYADFNDYAGAIGATMVPGTGGGGSVAFTPSPGNLVTILYRGGAAGPGWAATAQNAGVATATRDECGIFIGPVANSPNAAVTEPGVAVCY
ncbi:MAG TPA: prepilin-type N-terminal cleavage/methylation domain-containing protein [Gemmatimonadales bacterium]|nr:prepilin-type N-terminal cleavage/methylation domain-containing protein [Gemmatimonadales bacterium]